MIFEEPIRDQLNIEGTNNFSHYIRASVPISRWISAYPLSSSYKIKKNHEDAISRLIPLLLCGEQSAQKVFGNEAKRLEKKSLDQSYKIFNKIELEEYGHDFALRHMQNMLPISDDHKNILRRSKIFFASLGRVETIPKHFIQISKLDSYVSRILQSIILSELPRNHPFSFLCQIIKADEARHVSISHHHAIAMGAGRYDFEIENEKITKKFIKFLNFERQSFEDLGINTLKLFKQLENLSDGEVFKK